MFDLLIRSAPARTKSLARRGLTPNDARGLFSLDSGAGRSMRSLADEWECDPSNATWRRSAYIARMNLADSEVSWQGVERTRSATAPTSASTPGLVELNQDRDGVIARVRNRSTGLEDTVRAQYLIGADGTQSVVREADINGTLVPRGDGRWLMFDAALDRLQVRSPANDTTMHVSRR
jgi:hypothetical protein